MSSIFVYRGVMLSAFRDLVNRCLDTPPTRILDLGSGPGSVSRWLLDTFPDATVVAFDFDPVLMHIGEQALASYGDRVQWVTGNLRESGWSQALKPLGPFDVVLSVATMHHFGKAELRSIFAELATIIREGGVFANTEGLASGAIHEALNQQMREVRRTGERQEMDWWDRIRAMPELAELLEQRDALVGQYNSHEKYLSAALHARMLRGAGFEEAMVAARYLDEALMVARR